MPTRYSLATVVVTGLLFHGVLGPPTPNPSRLIVPLQVAVPLVSTAVVGIEVYPEPAAVMVKAVPAAIVFVPVRATVAVAPEPPPLKVPTLQVWVDDPVIVPPLKYSADWTL